MAIGHIKIIQHNVLHWRTNYLSLANYYRSTDPEIILLNAHGNQNNDKIKLFNYNIVQNNSTGQIHDGIAICIKKSLQFQPLEGFIENWYHGGASFGRGYSYK